MAESGVPWEDGHGAWCCPECFILFSLNVFRVRKFGEGAYDRLVVGVACGRCLAVLVGTGHAYCGLRGAGAGRGLQNSVAARGVVLQRYVGSK